VLVGLIGEGQEIYSGEEAGIGQWREAVLASDSSEWHVHVPDDVADDFAGCAVTTHPKLHLTVSLRSRRAMYLHRWVSQLLAGSPSLAARVASRLDSDRAAFPLYVTRNLDLAKDYARSRYADEPGKRYGLLVAAHAKVPRRYGYEQAKDRSMVQCAAGRPFVLLSADNAGD
jgi:schlafen family protein